MKIDLLPKIKHTERIPEIVKNQVAIEIFVVK